MRLNQIERDKTKTKSNTKSIDGAPHHPASIDSYQRTRHRGTLLFSLVQWHAVPTSPTRLVKIIFHPPFFADRQWQDRDFRIGSGPNDTEHETKRFLRSRCPQSRIHCTHAFPRGGTKNRLGTSLPTIGVSAMVLFPDRFPLSINKVVSPPHSPVLPPFLPSSLVFHPSFPQASVSANCPAIPLKKKAPIT